MVVEIGIREHTQHSRAKTKIKYKKMSSYTDILHEFCYVRQLREGVCIKAIIGHIYLKVEGQSQERYKYVGSYDQGLHFGLYRVYIAIFYL